MRKKRRVISTIFFIIVLTAAVLMYNLLSESSTFAVATVLEKDRSEENGEGYIIVAPPNADLSKKYLEEEKSKIFIKETMVWNLIENGKTYVVTYETKGNGVSILKEIENADK